MAIIDTLKLARALHETGGFTQPAADATATALNEALGEDVATKADITGLRTDLKADITRLDGRITALTWAVGINAAVTIAVFGMLLTMASRLGEIGGQLAIIVRTIH